MSNNQSNLEIKQHLQELGLYEPGMTVHDMETVYTTVNKSKESASLEKDFRQLLAQTDENCLNMHNLTQSSHGSRDTTLQDDKMDSSKNVVVREKKNEAQLNSSMETDAHSSDTDIITCTTSTPVKPFKRNIARNNDNIDVFIPAAGISKPLELHVPHNKNRSPSAILHHPTVLKLPVEQRAKLIYKSHIVQIEKYKGIRRTAINTVRWGEPIKPTQAKQFNGDLCVDAVPCVEEPDEIRTGEVKSGQAKGKISRKKEGNKPKRQVKRKNYKEMDSSDDDKDFVTNNNKKSRVGNGVVTRGGTRNNVAENKRNTKSKKISLSLSAPDVSDRTNRIFDELKKQDVVKTRQQKSKQTELVEYNGSSDDEDIFPTGQQTTTTTVEVHGSNKTGHTIATRQNKLAETEQQNTSTKSIAAKYFYARNSRDKAPQISNNNEERKTECPICRSSFPISVIENHASSCIQFEEEEEEGEIISEAFCDICEKRIPLTIDIHMHRQQCIKFICEQSEETPKCDTNDNKVGGGGMCSICDKYFMNGTDMNKHANECIKSIKRK